MNGEQRLERRIYGTRGDFFWREFFTNSAHFPIVNIIYELLLGSPAEYLWEPDLYLLLGAALLQAWWSSGWAYRGTPHPLPGNLIGPLFYMSCEVLLEGSQILAAPHHLAYWGFAAGIGVLQWWQLGERSRGLRIALVLSEHVLRTSILLVMYVLLEYEVDDYAGVGEFFADAPHRFVGIVVPLLGVIVGLAHLNGERYLGILRETAAQLRTFSEWLLGKQLLARAMENPASLTLTRHERALYFLDIRGFTAWSEPREPEEVVAMVNAFYQAAEPVWLAHHAIKVKLTADEIMLVFAAVDDAVAAGQQMRKVLGPLLAAEGLAAGAGIHVGPVVEGLMGPAGRQGYDLLGDAVNTAKRLCDNAAGGELLLSVEAAAQHKGALALGAKRQLVLKGKEMVQEVYALD